MRAAAARAPRALTLSSRLRTGSAQQRAAAHQLRAGNVLRTSVILRAVSVAHVLSRASLSRDFSVRAQAAAVMSAPTSNPLLADAELPLYDKIKAEDVVPGITQLCTELGKEIDELEKNVKPTWEGCVEPLERISDRLQRIWGSVSHLKAVRDSEALRKAVEEVQPLKVALGLRLAQSLPLYEAFVAMKTGPTWVSLSEAQRRLVEGEIRDATLSGVALKGEKKERFNAIQQELSKLATDFSNNVLDSTKAFTRVCTTEEEVAGLPPSALGLAAQTAVAKGHEGATPEKGPWAFTLDLPSYMAVLQHAKNRDLREALYRAYITRASSGDVDNGPLIERTLALKRERAELLGYPNHAEVSLASKMATLESALKLIEELRVASFEPAKQELEDVRKFAKSKGAAEADDLKHWDVTYWAERLREEKYGLKEEELRPYFPLPQVLDGLFALVKRLFDVNITPADGESPVWHPDVRFFAIKDNAGTPIAYFYLDPYSRPAEKRGGAWMDEVVGRSRLFARDGKPARLPVAHMVCNGTPPVGGKPSLMTFREVETLFHEAGHALQHMLTRVDEGLVAGIRGVEWDAVELPSQFMENWCYHRPTLMQLARHVDTGAPLPDELFEKLKAAKTFRAASMMLRQLHFAQVDLELHSTYVAGGKENANDVNARVALRTTVMPPLPEDRFLCSFSHIFAGGYSAGYYSYKYAEVLSADAFGAFEDAGLDDEKAIATTGRRFRDTVLALGGARAPIDVFKDFRGREPSTQSLLRHSGLAVAAR